MDKKLSEENFLKSFELVPRVAVDLIVEDRRGRVLLTKRARQPLVGVWHIPGSFLFKGESMADCVKRVARNELGLDKRFVSEQLGAYENLNTDPRGHIIDVIYKVRTEKGIDMITNEDTGEMRFFEKLPENIGFNHREILEILGYR